MDSEITKHKISFYFNAMLVKKNGTRIGSQDKRRSVKTLDIEILGSLIIKMVADISLYPRMTRGLERLPILKILMELTQKMTLHNQTYTF